MKSHKTLLLMLLTVLTAAMPHSALAYDVIKITKADGATTVTAVDSISFTCTDPAGNVHNNYVALITHYNNASDTIYNPKSYCRLTSGDDTGFLLFTDKTANIIFDGQFKLLSEFQPEGTIFNNKYKYIEYKASEDWVKVSDTNSSRIGSAQLYETTGKIHLEPNLTGQPRTARLIARGPTTSLGPYKPYTFADTLLIVQPAIEYPYSNLAYTIGSFGQTFEATFAKPLTIDISQSSTLVTAGSDVFRSGEFKATISVSLASNSVDVTADKSIWNLTEVTPETITTQTEQEVCHQQTFNLGGEDISFNISYAIPPLQDGHQLAYVKLSPARFKQIGRATNKDGKYVARALFEVDIESMQASEKKTETITISTDFYTKGDHLVKVVYTPSYDWEEEHHNIMLNFGLQVCRDRIYSDGSVKRDIIMSPRYFARTAADGRYQGGPEVSDYISLTPDQPQGSATLITKENETIDVRAELLSAKKHDTDKIELHGEIGVNDLSRITVEHSDLSIPHRTDYCWFGEQTDEIYKKKCDLGDVEQIMDASLVGDVGRPAGELGSGWYFCMIEIKYEPKASRCFYLPMDPYVAADYKLVENNQTIAFPILFLVIDGRIIQPDEWLPKDIVDIHDYKVNGNEADFEHYKKVTYLNREFSYRNTTHFYTK